jgi:glycosyltransferase involved in cell wall biosynthesis
MNLVYVSADNPHEWNSSEWRCAAPARAINRGSDAHADVVDVRAWLTGAADALCESADLIIVQRVLLGPVLDAILHWKARGKTVLAEFDDAYDKMPDSNPAYAFWHKGWARNPDGRVDVIEPTPITQFAWGLALCDAASMPSHLLAADWAHLVPTVVVPNWIDLDAYRRTDGRRDDRTDGPTDGRTDSPPVRRSIHPSVLRIGWGGSLSHLHSFTESGVLKALERVCRARPQVCVVIHGADGRIVDALRLQEHQRLHRPWVPYTEWPAHLAEVDIGIAPLEGAYDQRRSWIKALEYLTLGIPWIASEGPVYADLARFGTLVPNSALAWEHALLDLIDHWPERKALALQAAREHAGRFSLDARRDDLLDIYRHVLQTKTRTAAAAPA